MKIILMYFYIHTVLFDVLYNMLYIYAIYMLYVGYFENQNIKKYS